MATAVQRYRDARPYFHPVVIGMIRRKLGLVTGEKLHQGVDVGCGTGQSVVALLELADSVTGVDNSEQMLAHAEKRIRVEYVHGSAEQLPVAGRSADIVTVSLALHWFDVPVFLAEAARVLRPGGWLVPYSNSFRAQMVGNPAFHDWCAEVYGVRYPTPPRPADDPSAKPFEGSRFEWIKTEQYENEVSFTPEQLVAYLMTHSNVIAAVEQGDEDADEVRSFLREQVTPFFNSALDTFLFGGGVTYARLSNGC